MVLSWENLFFSNYRAKFEMENLSEKANCYNLNKHPASTEIVTIYLLVMFYNWI